MTASRIAGSGAGSQVLPATAPAVLPSMGDAVVAPVRPSVRQRACKPLPRLGGLSTRVRSVTCGLAPPRVDTPFRLTPTFRTRTSGYRRTPGRVKTGRLMAVLRVTTAGYGPSRPFAGACLLQHFDPGVTDGPIMPSALQPCYRPYRWLLKHVEVQVWLISYELPRRF